MPPNPGPIAAIESALMSEEDAISAYKVAVTRASAILDIRRFGEFLRMHQNAACALSRVRARLLAKVGTWGHPWDAGRLPPGAAQRVGAALDEVGMFEVLAAAEKQHANKVVTLLVGTESDLPRDAYMLLERIVAETDEHQAWLNERASGVTVTNAAPTSIARAPGPLAVVVQGW